MIGVFFFAYTGIAIGMATMLSVFAIALVVGEREGEAVSLGGSAIGLSSGLAIVLYRLSYAVDYPDFPEALLVGTAVAPIISAVAGMILCRIESVRSFNVSAVKLAISRRDWGGIACSGVILVLLLLLLGHALVSGRESTLQSLNEGSNLGVVVVTTLLYFLILIVPCLWGITRSVSAIVRAIGGKDQAK